MEMTFQGGSAPIEPSLGLPPVAVLPGTGVPSFVEVLRDGRSANAAERPSVRCSAAGAPERGRRRRQRDAARCLRQRGRPRATDATRRGARFPCRACQRGVGLIEILVTVVLLSIGFLAAATMQIRGMHASQSAYYQSQAYFLVTGMMDRMRSNIAGVELGDYDSLRTSASASDPGCASRSCDAAATARQDLYDWSARLYPMGETTGFVASLPPSSIDPPLGTVTRLADGLYEVALSWTEVVDGEESRETLGIRFITESD